MGEAVRAEDVGKKYVIRHRTAGSYVALRDVLAERAQGMATRVMRPVRRSKAGAEDRRREDFWALRDVDFTIEHGESVGIIGRNGAGKSTLLKVLSRITPPTTGRVVLEGGVASLLEVGTGFHPELTGRENIYLNGAVLGMGRAEIRSRFDEIVAFAEVEKFLDTPVKRYSSGMYVRLAFAVAAHLEPEILIVDEVLSVGDASFQKKCLKKMEGVGREGRTVLFVSHNISTVTRLCNRAILMDGGKIIADGPSERVAAMYLQSGLGTSAERVWDEAYRAPGNEVARLRRVRCYTEDGEVLEAFDIRRPIGIDIEFDVLGDGYVLVPSIDVWNDDGICVLSALDLDPQWRGRPRVPGRYRTTVWIPGNYLSEQRLSVRVAISTHAPYKVHADAPDAVAFMVTDGLDGDSARGDYGGGMPGITRPYLTWSNSIIEPAGDGLAHVGGI